MEGITDLCRVDGLYTRRSRDIQNTNKIGHVSINLINEKNRDKTATNFFLCTALLRSNGKFSS
jgi:hypothetical protein